MTTLTKKPAGKQPAKVNRKGWWLVIALTSVAIAVYFSSQYFTASLKSAAAAGSGLAGTYANDSLFIRGVFYVHITFAGIALLIGPLQFSKRLRSRAINVHRWVGRTYISSVAIGSVAAFIMSLVSSVALLGFFGFGSLAVLWAWTTRQGYRAARTGEIASHQAWMIRSFALTYAAVTLRVWFILFLVALSILAKNVLTAEQIAAYAYAPVPFLCWLPNIVVAELIIRRRNLPGLRFTTSRPSEPANR